MGMTCRSRVSRRAVASSAWLSQAIPSGSVQASLSAGTDTVQRPKPPSESGYDAGAGGGSLPSPAGSGPASR